MACCLGLPLHAQRRYPAAAALHAQTLDTNFTVAKYFDLGANAKIGVLKIHSPQFLFCGYSAPCGDAKSPTRVPVGMIKCWDLVSSNEFPVLVSACVGTPLVGMATSVLSSACEPCLTSPRVCVSSGRLPRTVRTATGTPSPTWLWRT